MWFPLYMETMFFGMVTGLSWRFSYSNPREQTANFVLLKGNIGQPNCTSFLCRCRKYRKYMQTPWEVRQSGFVWTFMIKGQCFDSFSSKYIKSESGIHQWTLIFGGLDFFPPDFMVTLRDFPQADTTPEPTHNWTLTSWMCIEPQISYCSTTSGRWARHTIGVFEFLIIYGHLMIFEDSCTLWQSNIAIENGNLEWVFPWKMVLSHSFLIINTWLLMTLDHQQLLDLGGSPWLFPWSLPRSIHRANSLRSMQAIFGSRWTELHLSKQHGVPKEDPVRIAWGPNIPWLISSLYTRVSVRMLLYVYMCICMYVYMYIYTHICIYIYMYVIIYAYLYLHTYIYISPLLCPLISLNHSIFPWWLFPSSGLSQRWQDAVPRPRGWRDPWPSESSPPSAAASAFCEWDAYGIWMERQPRILIKDHMEHHNSSTIRCFFLCFWDIWYPPSEPLMSCSRPRSSSTTKISQHKEIQSKGEDRDGWFICGLYKIVKQSHGWKILNLDLRNYMMIT